MAHRRNANNEGSMVYDSKRDMYRFYITIDGVRKAFSGKTQSAAKERYKDWLENDAYAPLSATMTIKQWGEKWYKEYSQKVEESTAAGYEFTLQHIIKRVGNIKVCDLMAFHVEKMLEDEAKEYSQSYVGKCRAMLGQIMRKAEANGLTKKNPVPLADQLNYRRVGSKKKKIKESYTENEIYTLFQKLPNTRIGNSIRVMLGTSQSTQEILGVSALDIAKDGSTIRILRAVKLKKGGGMYIGDVKAEKRDRIAKVPPSARPAAIYLREHAEGFIIQGQKSGLPIHPNTFREFYYEAVRPILGDRTLSPHCCRHSYISHLENHNVDFAVIQALAGQSEKESTIEYIHAQSDAIQGAVDIIEQIISGKSGSAQTVQLPAAKDAEKA